MSLTSRKRRPLDRTTGALRDARLIVIATEGEKTEKAYFEHFSKHDSRIQMKVLPAERGRSAPRHVLRRLRDFKDRSELKADDQLWLVIDKDRWRDEHLSQVAAEAKRQRFEIAISNPCFELWLYLHLADTAPSMDGEPCPFFKRKIREILGEYDPARLNMAAFNKHINRAVERAEGLDADRREAWPNKMGTRVYRVIKSFPHEA